MDNEERTRIQSEIAMLKDLLNADVGYYKDQGKQDLRPMSKADRINLTWSMPQLPDTLMELIEEVGFKTGSAIFSDVVANDDDWVVNVPPKAFEGYAVGMMDEGYWQSDGMSSLYAHYDNRLINIICMSDWKLATAWRITTEFMKKLQYMEIQVGPIDTAKDIPLAEAFNTKWKRVRVFRALVDVLWPVQDLRVHLSEYDAKKYQKYQATGICERCSTNSRTTVM